MTTVESLKQRKMNCVFVSDWTCYVEADEIPLEVCRICLEARKTHASERAKRQIVTRQTNEGTEREIKIESFHQPLTANQ